MISKQQIDDYERLANSSPHTHERQIIQDLLIEVSRLKHELEDPLFMYAGSRITRHAIINREEQIKQLMYEVGDLKMRIGR